MLYTSQCVNLPDGASGSSTIKAKLLVFFGASSQASGGEAFRPSRESVSGMTPPSLKPLLLNLMSTSPSVWTLLRLGAFHVTSFIRRIRTYAGKMGQFY